MHGGIGPPGAPALGMARERAIGQVRRAAEREVANGECVRIAQRAHGDVLRGPRSDARQLAQLRNRRASVVIVVEGERARGDCGRERPNRRRSRTREPCVLEGGVAERRCVRERPAKALARGVHSRPERSSDPAHERCGASDRRLLADNRADRQLERIPRARHPQARMTPETSAQQRVELEVPFDGVWIGIDIEHQADAPQNPIHRLRIRMMYFHDERAAICIMRDVDRAGSCPRHKRATVMAVRHGFETRHRTALQELQQCLPVIWRPIPEPEASRAWSSASAERGAT